MSKLKLAILSMALLCTFFSHAQTIRSVLFDPPPQGNPDGPYEYVEIQWTPNTSLAGIWLIYIDGDGATNAGKVRDIRNLSSYSTGANGLLLVRNTLNTSIILQPAPLAQTNVVYPDEFNWNNGSGTFLLINGTPPSNGTDLDTNNDGIIEVAIGFTVINAVSTFDNDGSNDYTYADDFGGTVIPDVPGTRSDGFVLIDGNYYGFNVEAGSNQTGPFIIDNIWNPIGSTPSGVTLPAALEPGSSTASPLPIELISFKGKQQENSIYLTWETATETNNAFMAVERSRDGQKFVEIGQRKGHGTSLIPQFYNFIDINPLSGINYYRLRQVDVDEKATYHDIIAIIFKNDRKNLVVFPTITSDKINLLLNENLTQNGQITITSPSGAILLQQTLAGSSQEELSLTQLPAGAYMLTVKSNRNSESVRFIKY